MVQVKKQGNRNTYKFWNKGNVFQISFLERKTGLEPATTRLEIWDSTIEVLPQDIVEKIYLKWVV